MTIASIDRQGLSKSEIMNRLDGLRNYMQAEGDMERVNQLDGLIHKGEANRFYIAFCGHFSAGKSTLINQLCGYPLLPSSPIPTSANIVSIANGSNGAVVIERKQAGMDTLMKPVQLEDLAAYCVDGKGIERVEITFDLPFLGKHAALLDTPGIDSTDDAHHMATESALYLADVVFYVMDYNHVQSEINLAFAKQMKERGKPLYLIVNMIDKHREEELPFDTYCEGVDHVFQSWGIQPDGVLYVSMKAPQHPRNDWEKLCALIAELISRGNELSSYSMDEAARHLLEEHREARSQQLAPRKATLDEALAGEGEALAKQREELQQGLASAQQEPQRLQAALRREVTGIIENANVTPAVARDVAHHYLQSREAGFKAGFFARASQTAAEIQKRLDKLHEAFISSVSTQLERHLQILMREATNKAGLETPAFIEVIDNIHMDISPAWLAGQVNTAAVFGNEYTLNYMKQVASEVKAHYKKKAYEAIDLLVAEAEQAAKQLVIMQSEAITKLDVRLEAYDERKRIEAQEAEADRKLYALMGKVLLSVPELPNLHSLSTNLSANKWLRVQKDNKLHTASIDVVLRASHTNEHLNDSQSVESQLQEQAMSDNLARADLVKKRAGSFLTAAQAMGDIPALKLIARSLTDKANRLIKQTYTVALFGAFSAGKSSFANALMGERVLPVSPNPTTAAINRIMPPESDWPHGSARVTMKSFEALLSDVLYSLELLGVKVSDMQTALQAIKELSPNHVTAKGKPHYSFLRAVHKGWNEAEPLLGTEIRANHEQFTQYVAEESKSCFIDGIVLYYSSPLTDQGIVLVDTPGADSINARHTGVAFNYIKNADAILFVTYYNHAFSHADKEFLLQLGRVKDAFELDKMFFIVNAADLAASEEELSGVVRHVESNLLAHGIRHPRIYPISSQNAADGKLKNDHALLAESGLPPFEADFTKYAFDELSQVAIRSAEAEFKRGIHTLDRLIGEMQASEEERNVRIVHLQATYTQASQVLGVSDADDMGRELTREIAELLYYVKQRTMYRYGELFAYSFNPAVFRDESKDSKEILVSAWNELLRLISFDLEQEGLATTLRIEKAINKMYSKQYDKWGHMLQTVADGYEYESYEARRLPTPQITIQAKASEVNAKLLSSFYKNAKYFFESDGRNKLKAELEKYLNEGIADELKQLEHTLIQTYSDYLTTGLTELQEGQEAALSEYIQGSIAALEMKIDVSTLNDKRYLLSQYVASEA